MTALGAATAQAAEINAYYVVVPVPGKRAPAVPAPLISVVLAAAVLPPGTLGALYPPINLNKSLQVTGDSNFDAAQVAWKVATGSLPVGLAINAGVLSGTPTEPTASASFTVQATYKLSSGQQAYTIVVNGVTLQVTSISAGEAHTCAVTTSGGAKCWGQNAYGQLGDGTDFQRASLVDVLGLTSGVATLAAGPRHTCAVTTAGGVKCWGYNFYGQLGDGTTVPHTSPADVTGLLSGVASISLGTKHTCAVTTGGVAKCWGNNSFGQVGDGSVTQRLTPVDVSTMATGVLSISAADEHTCAVTTEGSAKCWGNNSSGQLGDNSLVTRRAPVLVATLASGVASIAAGTSHTCARTAAGGATCWGYNYSGQLGDGTTVQRRTPVAVTGLASGVVSLAVGGSHACVITDAGGVQCWGANANGQLGNGAAVDQLTPVPVWGLTSGVASITAAGRHTCAALASGSSRCWGFNSNGQLGDGTRLDKSAPGGVLP